MYRIRFHGRGGQGMKTASHILGNAFFLQNYEVQDAPRYGAERRGAPIFAYVRAAKQAIYERGIIAHPDLVIVADDSLVPVPAAGVMQGVKPDTVLLINSAEPADVWAHRLNITSPIVILPVMENVEDRAELKYVSATCAGAAARLTDVVTKESLQQAIQQELGQIKHLSQEVVNKNLEVALAAYDHIDQHSEVRITEGGDISAHDYADPQLIELPFDDATISAPIIHNKLTSVKVNTGLWRTMRPVIDYDRCNRCWWVCSSYCPDSAIKVDDGKPVIDYEHCKGCMICVAQCPPHAISAIAETEAQAMENKEEQEKA